MKLQDLNSLIQDDIDVCVESQLFNEVSEDIINALTIHLQNIVVARFAEFYVEQERGN